MPDEIIVYSTILKLVFAFVGFEVALWLLRRMDRRNGVNWTDQVWKVMGADALALAVYYGLRFVGVALLVGLVIS